MRVQIVDPPAFTPPYDHALCAALARLATRHPLRCAMDPLRRNPGSPRLSALAPAAVRLLHEPGARVHALGGEEVHATAHRLATLSGRRLEDRRNRS